MENPIKIDDLGVPLFLETSISLTFTHTQKKKLSYQILKVAGEKTPNKPNKSKEQWTRRRRTKKRDGETGHLQRFRFGGWKVTTDLTISGEAKKNPSTPKMVPIIFVSCASHVLVEQDSDLELGFEEDWKDLRWHVRWMCWF